MANISVLQADDGFFFKSYLCIFGQRKRLVRKYLQSYYYYYHEVLVIRIIKYKNSEIITNRPIFTDNKAKSESRGQKFGMLCRAIFFFDFHIKTLFHCAHGSSNIFGSCHKNLFRILGFLDPLQTFLPAFKPFIHRGFTLNQKNDFLLFSF